MNTIKLLIVDDVEDNRLVLKAICRKLKNFEIREAEDGFGAVEIAKEWHPDIILMDIMMPNMDGFEFVKTMRASGLNMPVLMITAKDTFEDMQSGFLAGTDDYMVKPVNVNEMILRINALLKRAQIVNEKKIRFENAELRYDDLTVCIGSDCNVLPQKEFYILYKLLSNPNRVFTKQQIMDEIWGMDTESDPHTLDVHISRLRERFKDNAQFEIVTIRGLGYKAVKKHA